MSQPDRTLPPTVAEPYLRAKFDQLITAVAGGDRAAALDVVREVRSDGFGAAADEVLDTLIAVLESTATPLPAGSAPPGSTSPDPCGYCGGPVPCPCRSELEYGPGSTSPEPGPEGGAA